MTTQAAPMGHNNPPEPTIPERLAEHFGAHAVVGRHLPVFHQAEAVRGRADALPDKITAPDQEEAATAVVKDCRAVVTALAARKALEKAPILNAGSTIEAVFKAEADRVGMSKAKAERLLSVAAQERAAEQVRIRNEAANKAREEAAANANAAAALEAAGHTTAAGIVLDQAVKSERAAELHEARAAGPIADLARQQNAAGTVGLRTELTFEISEPDALRATLGPLGRCFTQQAVEAAIRQYVAEHKRTQPKGSLPVLAGVTFKLDEKANIR